MKKLTINDFTAMQLFEYADKIEMASTHKIGEFQVIEKKQQKKYGTVCLVKLLVLIGEIQKYFKY